ncbi:carbon storage regulator [Caproiciproducens sp. LBM24188]
MLVISRKVSESILIGDNIELVVSEVSGDRVKICINAPKEVHIVRKELLETQELNREASILPKQDALEEVKNRLKRK